MAVTINAKGTSNPHFRIGKQGTTIYQGSGDPTGSYTASAGDVWIDTTNLTLKHRNSGNSAWVQGTIDITGDATISGNLTVNGTTTVIDTTFLKVEDPLVVIARNQSGSPAYDAGLIVERGSSTNVGMIWDESADQFSFINTADVGDTSGNVTIASFADLRAGVYYGDGSNLTGITASSATILASARTIGGVSFNGSANIVPTTITVADSTDTTTFVGLWESATGDLLPKTDAGLTYNAGTGMLTATGFTGPLTGNASGTAATVTGAAQAAITSLGTLTTLTVDNVIINGTTIGHTSDTDLMTLSSGTLDIAGTLDANNITISAAQGSDGDVLTSTGSGVAWEAAAGGGGTDISGLQNDIATLALYVTTQHSQAAYNLPNTFVDQYQDNTGIDTTSTAMYTEGTHVVTGNPGAGLVGYANDTNTILLLHFDGSNGSEVFTDDSSNAAVMTASYMNMTVSSVDRAPIGGAAANIYHSSSVMTTPGIAAMDCEDSNFTIEFWIRTTGLTDSPIFDFNTQDTLDGEDMHFEMTYAEGGAEEFSFELGGGGEYGGHFIWIFPTVDCDDDTWHHYAVVRDRDFGDDGQWFFYYDGVSQTATGESDDVTDEMNGNLNRDNNPMKFFKSMSFTSGRFTGSPCRMDEFRFSNIARYPSGTTFVPNPGPITTATGNYTSTTETANATVSNMGIVILYKNDSGTATLDTDLIAEVSADGGTNWTSAPLTAGGTFSTGILIAKSNDITISNTGTTCKYRISFANQSAGSKVTEVHGVSLLY